MLFDIHVCLISEQATPNLTPVLSVDFRPKMVVALVTHTMKDKADFLEAVYKKYQVKMQRLVLNDAYDMADIQNKLMTLLSELDGQSIALNVTGGTKTMALAAQAVFLMDEKPLFYVRPDTNEVLFMGGKTPSIQLSIKLKLADFLSAHGYQALLRTNQPALNCHDLTKNLVKNVTSFSKAIGTMNRLAQSAAEKDQRRGYEIERPCLDIELSESDAHFSKLLDDFTAAKLIRVQGSRIFFTSIEARTYANGGWLEEYVLSVVSQLNGIQDAARSLEVKNTGGDGHAKNEIDVAFLARNRLHLIECKTRNFARDSKIGTETVYKLDSLTDLGGLNTKGMLVSYRELDPATKDRAKDKRIKTVDANQLHDLKNQIQSWISR